MCMNTCTIMHVHTLTSFSESPRHLLTMDEAEMLKNVVLHSVATALASSVFPVPERVKGQRLHYTHNHICTMIPV